MNAWMEHAECRSHDPETFFPTYTLREAVEPALKICGGCPVKRDCLAFAKQTGATDGVWGGVLINRRQNGRLTAEEEQELLDGIKTGLESGWTIEQTAKHLRINLQRAKKYQRIIVASAPEEPGKGSLIGRMRRMLPW